MPLTFQISEGLQLAFAYRVPDQASRQVACIFLPAAAELPVKSLGRPVKAGGSHSSGPDIAIGNRFHHLLAITSPWRNYSALSRNPFWGMAAFAILP